MKITMSSHISGVGAIGEEVDVDAKLANRLVDDGHATKGAAEPDKDEKAKSASKPKTEMVEADDKKATT